MKKLILNIDEKVENELVHALGMKKLCGNPFELADGFIGKILQALGEKDTKEITLTMVPLKKQKKKK